MSLHEPLAEWAGWGWPLLANHLWQATLFMLLALLATALLKRGAARARYTIWLLAFAKLAVPSALLVGAVEQVGFKFPSFFHFSLQPSQNAALMLQIAQPMGPPPSSLGINREPGHSHNEVYCVLTLIWLLGCACLLGQWFRQRLQFWLVISKAQRAYAGREAKVLERLRSWIQMKRDIELVISPRTIEPGVWGICKPVVVLPDGIAAELSDSELEAVLMHELAHIERYDNLVSNLQMVVCCLLWFHPLVWILDRKLLNERELACDDEVLRLNRDSQSYATSILKVFRFCLGCKMAGVSYVTNSNLRRRIQMILSNNS